MYSLPGGGFSTTERPASLCYSNKHILGEQGLLQLWIIQITVKNTLELNRSRGRWMIWDSQGIKAGSRHYNYMDNYTVMHVASERFQLKGKSLHAPPLLLDVKQQSKLRTNKEITSIFLNMGTSWNFLVHCKYNSIRISWMFSNH